MGLHEYLQFCEDLGAEPLWVGFCGQTCIFRQMENVPMEEMGWVRDNFLDLVEYANGPADSKWGKLRAQAGHPAPFGLKYVEIGNENAEKAYEERYRFVYDAMKAKYPDLIYLADLSYYRMPAELYQIADRHYYNNPSWFLNRFNEYDSRDRSLAPLVSGRSGRDLAGRRSLPRQPPGGAGRGRVPDGLRAQRRRGADGLLRPSAGPRRRPDMGLARHDLPRRHAGLRHRVLLPLEALRPQSPELHGPDRCEA